VQSPDTRSLAWESDVVCGITGYWQHVGSDLDSMRDLVLRMAARIAHRGPDDAGAWVDADVGVALGHRRLSIVDLSAAGHQPMISRSRRYVLVFNGEIYNHANLRQRLEREAGHVLPWRGHSDTETLLAAIDLWGVIAALQACIGMFALALWDRGDRCLMLARDRMGEKPLYYGVQGGGNGRALMFGSELKALRAHPAFATHSSSEIDREALSLFMRLGYVPSPWTIYRGIRKLPPGTLAILRGPFTEPELQPYWSATEVMMRGHAAPLQIGPDEAVDQLEALLRSAVGQQMVADVPLGAFLSGGIDSSTVVALMQAQSSMPVRTFSIGFLEAGYDEAQHAKAVAAHLGTQHAELYVTPAEAMQVVPLLPAMYDEPFADSSQIPTHLVSRLARQTVTVALSGDAGDELFCGYNRYLMAQRLWGKLRAVPRPLRRAAATVLTAVTESTWNNIAAIAGHVLPLGRRYSRPGEKLHKGARAIGSIDIDALYLQLVSQWADPTQLVLGATEPTTVLTDTNTPLRALGDVPRMMAYDLLTYLSDDILAKVDRAAMAVSLETRVPLLDHRVIEFAWRIPMSMKLRGGVTKWLLRRVLSRYVPDALVERPKMGFGVPIDAWLRGPLREWAETLIDSRRLAADGLLKPEPIRRAWQAHMSGGVNLQYPLWNVLMFQSWIDSQ
jgi:asparagine synthase (glutamine-hydrolysing)